MAKLEIVGENARLTSASTLLQLWTSKIGVICEERRERRSVARTIHIIQRARVQDNRSQLQGRIVGRYVHIV